jgi:chromatin segregation and condensation protein Rec8/ScpA/Scc1 (kleisin family)
MIVTFLALLEMIRLKRVRVFQQANFGPIRVYRRERPDGAPQFSEALGQ